VESVHPRQHEIEHDQIRRFGRHVRQHGGSRRERVDRVLGSLKRVPEQPRDIGIVFDDQHAAHRRLS